MQRFTGSGWWPPAGPITCGAATMLIAPPGSPARAVWPGEPAGGSPRRGDRVEHLRPRKYMPSGPRNAYRRSGRAWGRVATLIGATALFTLVLPLGIGGAAPSQPMPTLKDLVAQARAPSTAISSRNAQHKGRRIQLTQAK